MILKNKVIVITGASGLIGREIFSDIKKKGGISINADINVETNLNNGLLKMDINDEKSIQNGIKLVLQHYNRIDGWVNNAYPRTKDWGTKFENINLKSWRKNVDMQLNSCFVCCQKVLGIMAEQKSGVIINIASIYGVVGNDFSLYEDYDGTSPAAYSAIKGGVINFTRYLASYYGKKGIRVNCVSPGGILDHQPKSFISKYNSKVPLGRMGNPEDIAPSVSFLLSDEARYITGQNLIVDGGWTSI